MSIFGLKFGSVESLLSKGVKVRKRKSKLLGRLQKMVTGLQKEEDKLRVVRTEMLELVDLLQTEDKLIEKELESISTVKSNIEDLLGIKKVEV